MSEFEEKGNYFLDSNIWLYAFIEGDDNQKTTLAKEVIKTGGIISVSTQVINEVSFNLRRKAQFSEQQIQQLIDSFYNKYSVVELNKPLLVQASQLRENYSFSFWDGIIVASALVSGASVLYSEDMHNGLFIEKQIRIINPFTIKQEQNC